MDYNILECFRIIAVIQILQFSIGFGILFSWTASTFVADILQRAKKNKEKRRHKDDLQ